VKGAEEEEERIFKRFIIMISNKGKVGFALKMYRGVEVQLHTFLINPGPRWG
jgi:hypothetical protein